MNLKNTKTAENLQAALAGESIARNKYTYFAQAARANGNEEVAAAFERMAKNEMMHARLWFEQLCGTPADTAECLMQAAQGEHDEWSSMYPEFARQAREEGLEYLAAMFMRVAAIEHSHEKEFLALLAKLNNPQADTSAPEQKKSGFRCQSCGAIFEERPDACETCGAIGAFEYINCPE